jgi:hypothetical protein
LEINNRCVLYAWTLGDEPEGMVSARLATCRALARALGMAVVDEYADALVANGAICNAKGLDAAVASVQTGETDWVIAATAREDCVNETYIRLVAETIAAYGGMVIGLYSDPSDRGTGRGPRNNTAIGKHILTSAVDGVVPMVASTCSERS